MRFAPARVLGASEETSLSSREHPRLGTPWVLGVVQCVSCLRVKLPAKLARWFLPVA